MKIWSCVQGTPQWLMLRAGKPTASDFKEIITPAGKPTTKDRREKYLCKLVAEILTGKPTVEFVSTWMNRGSSSEAEAVSYFELLTGKETSVIGFLTNDNETVGASPDRFVGEKELLEIKVPAPHTHVAYLLANATGGASVDAAYRPQSQGQMWIAERESNWVLSYNPEMPEALIKIERDESFITVLSAEMDRFCGLIAEAVFKLEQTGITKAREEEAQTGNEFLSEADLEWALSRSLDGLPYPSAASF